MTKKECAKIACEELEKLYPEAICSLEYNAPYELLIACRLSAQCTDARVNIVTKTLFKEYTSLEEFASADLEKLESIVKPCGCYKMKAKSIKELSQQLIENFGGELPSTIDELVTLSGVGRKTANLIMGDIWGQPAIVADTHCIRISGRLGLTDSKNPAIVEKDLVKVVVPQQSSDFCHRLVLFGRDICKARGEKCEICPMKGICRYYKSNVK